MTLVFIFLKATILFRYCSLEKLNQKKEWYCSISSNQPECFIWDNEGQILEIIPRKLGEPVCEKSSCEHLKLNTDMERCEDFDAEDYDYEMRNANYVTQGINYYFSMRH